jgi:2-amino-4-hydroxy-6-hydroxymethyldihydropteridine diphosphokinase
MLELLSRETKAHMNKFYVLIGSNIDPHNNINLCLEKIAAYSDLEQIQLSSFYESEAFGMEGDNFINAVIYLKSKKNHKEILSLLKQIEHECGRVRDPKNKFTPRTLDLDIIDWNGFTGMLDDKQYPDPEIQQRDFIKIPYLELKAT